MGRLKSGSLMSAEAFAAVRTTASYANNALCGWRIRPSVVPTGFKLRVSFDFVNTERGYDFVTLYDGDGGTLFDDYDLHDLHRYGGSLPPAVSGVVTTLVQTSGQQQPLPRIAESESALLLFHSDSSATRQGGFVFRYELQPLQPPSRPSAVVIDETLVTRTGAYASWTAPVSVVPLLYYRLLWRPSDTPDVTEFEQVVSATQSGSALLGLAHGTSYDVRLQAWTETVDPSRCSGGTSLCSEISPVANFTTRSLATEWHVATEGSYLYGDGSPNAPFAMDLQGVIDRADVLNGAEIVLAPGVYSPSAMLGPGSVTNLNLRGKIVSIRALTTASETIIDCGGTARFITFNRTEPPSVELRELTIRNCGGDGDGRGALWVTGGARPTITNCTFVGNAAERGGAFVADAGAAPTFIGCTFADNNATSGCACSAAKRADSTCDAECSSRACGWDYLGQCCSSACEQGWGDGICVAACNTAACGYDGGDCCPTSTCATSRADGTCDSACNVAACGFDGGDCAVDAGLTWGGYDLAEHVGYDGLGKGGVGAVISGAHVAMTDCAFISNRGELGGAFYVQGCRADRSSDAPCDATLSAASSSLTLTRCTSSSNLALNNGGLVYATIGARVSVDGLLADADGAIAQGGLLWAGQGSTLSVTGSIITRSTADEGGALYATDASATIVDTLVDCTGGTAATSGGGMLFTEGATAALSRSTVAKCAAARGGAMQLQSRALAPRGPGRTDTYAISVAPRVTLDATNLTGCTASVAGGGIDAVGTSTLRVLVTMTHSTIADAHAPGGLGGGIAVASGVVDMVSSNMLRSHAQHGASIYADVASSVAINSSALRDGNASGDGGGIFALAGTLVVVGDMTSFEHNAAGGSGGAMRLSSATATVDGRSSLSANRATLGGGISALSSTILMADIDVVQNDATSGGGAYVEGSNLVVDSVELLENSASVSGGGIAAVEGSQLDVRNCNARRNRSPNGAGGAMRVERSSLAIEATTFVANVAGNGGALSIAERASAQPALRAVVFERNMAQTPLSGTAISSEIKGEGGAVHLTSVGTTNVDECTFGSNSARSGGALAAIASTTLDLRGAVLRNNSASVNGGGVMIMLGTLLSNGDVYENNSATAGGAAFFLSSVATIHNATAVSNIARSSGGALECSNSELTLGSSVVSGNVAGLGGGVCLRSQSSAAVSTSTFARNTAANGAGLAVQDAQLDLSACEVMSNEASESGGGVYGRSATSMDLRNLTVDGNRAAVGGGFFLRESAPVITDVTMRANRAAVGAGVKLQACTSAAIRRSTFEFNQAGDEQLSATADSTAPVEGGGIACDGGTALTLTNTSLRSNEARSVAGTRGIGGGLAARDCTGSLHAVTFESNQANQAGGVLWRGSAVLTLDDGTFEANVGLVNIYSGAIMWGAESSAGGGVAGGGLDMVGCTRFADGAGNALSLGAQCDGSSRRSRRRLSGISAAMLGISTPVDRLFWSAPWLSEGQQAVSGDLFPNCTLVMARDAYNNTVPTAEGVVTANGGAADICDVCGSTSPLVLGVASFCTLGLTALPGTTAAVSFTSTVGSPSTAMPVPMALCEPGEYLDAVARMCRTCPAGSHMSTAGNATACTPCPAGAISDRTGAATCTACPAGTKAAAPGQTICALCEPGTASNAERTDCPGCLPGSQAPGTGNGECVLCLAGTFQSQSNGVLCEPCPDAPQHSYSLDGSDACEVCHSGANCTQGLWYGSKSGWWSHRSLKLANRTDGGVHTLTGRVELYQPCKPINGFSSSRCLGGANSTCELGHWGPLCSLCKPFHRKDKNAAIVTDNRTDAYNGSFCRPCEAAVWAAEQAGGDYASLVPYFASRESVFLGFVPITIKMYDANTHQVAYALHAFIAISSALVVVVFAIGMWLTTKDPLDDKKRQKASLKERVKGISRRRSSVGGRRANTADPEAPVKGVPVDAFPSPPPSPPPHWASAGGGHAAVGTRRTWMTWLEECFVVDKDDHARFEEEDDDEVDMDTSGLDEFEVDEAEEMIEMWAAEGHVPSPPPSAPHSPPLSPPPSPPANAGALTSRILADNRGLGVSTGAPPGVGSLTGDLAATSKEKCKILVTHFQISSSFRFNLDFGLDFPWVSVNVFNDLFSFVNLDAIDLANIECIQPLNFYDGLFSTVLSASLILLAVPLTCLSLLGLQSLGWRLNCFKRTPRAQRVRVAFTDRTWNLFLMLCFFFFPPVSKRVFNTLHCVEVAPGQMYMWADLSLRCWNDPVHLQWVSFAIGAMIAFTFGIPAFSFVILYTNQRRLLLQTPRCKSRFGFLYAAYHDRVWYWELFEMFRKLMFTSIIMFCAGGTSTQVVLAMVIAFVSLIAHLHFQAYKEEPDSWLQTASLISIFITLWVGLLNRTGVTAELELPGSSVYSALYTSITVGVGALPIIAALLGLAAKGIKVLSKITDMCFKSDLLPDLGIGAVLKAMLPGATFQQKHDAALNLALAVNTDVAGEILIKGANKGQERKASVLERHLSKVDKALQEEGEVQQRLREHALAARAGKPLVKRDKQRRLYLMPLKLSAEAIVLRHFPFGKGFLVRLQDDDRYVDTEGEDALRPPYMFVKCWRMSYGRMSGAVHIMYDVRDTGWRLEREDVTYHPDEPNKALLVWEAKKALGKLDFGKVAAAGSNALKFAGRLGAKPTGLGSAAMAPTLDVAQPKAGDADAPRLREGGGIQPAEGAVVARGVSPVRSGPRAQHRQDGEDRAVMLMSSAATGNLDVEHYSQFKADLDRYLGEEQDPFLLSC